MKRSPDTTWTAWKSGVHSSEAFRSKSREKIHFSKTPATSP